MNTAGFLLDPDVIYLNHGAFGATPEAVFRVYQKWQLRLERNPMDFFLRVLEPALEGSRLALASFVGSPPERLAFVENATTGVNQVAWSLQLGPDDEVLVNDHEYGAILHTWRILSERFGFQVRTAVLPFPVESPEQVLETLQGAVSDKTSCLCVSHITSPSALLFPVEEICAWARGRGIVTVVDGAHAPGHIELDLEKVGADFYTGNLHKWACAPKAAAFLYAREGATLRPLMISWGVEGWSASRGGSPGAWQRLVEQQGTRDLAAFLSVPAALRYPRKARPELVRRIQLSLAETVGLGTPGYWSDLQMGAIRMPDSTDPQKLQADLWREHRIEVPFFRLGDKVLLRISVNAYNEESDYEVLRRALV